ncbi:MAG: hypothetical protein AAF560_27140 [Acidobacteriota bacterium]
MRRRSKRPNLNLTFFPFFHGEDAVDGKRLDKGVIVRNHHERAALSPLSQEFSNFFAVSPIEVVGRLVEEGEPGRFGEGTQQTEAL